MTAKITRIFVPAIWAFPDTFKTALQKFLAEGCFPDRWKVQKLVLTMPDGIRIIRFADDVILAITVEIADDVEMKRNVQHFTAN